MLTSLLYTIKILLIRTLRLLLKFFYIFPIDSKKILFISYTGKQISCSPYYIYKKLKEKNPHTYIIYWVCQSKANDNRINDCCLQPKGFHYLYNLLTASVIVENDGLKPYYPFRKKQLIINTWHGGGLFKRTFGKMDKNQLYYLKQLHEITKNNTKLFLSSSRAWSEIVARKTFEYSGIILESGLPRNDILLDHSDYSSIKRSLRIPVEDKVILFAPTFRGGLSDRHQFKDVENIDSLSIINLLQKKSNCKYHFLFRGHHAVVNENVNHAINVTDYRDMQELLAIADIFISDYSSALWDFSLTYRPCFIYAPDFDEYVKSPGFESDYKKWPFPIAKNMEELLFEIDNFSQKDYKNKVSKYHLDYGSYENGNASEEAVNYINNYCNQCL